MTNNLQNPPLISVVIPVYNEKTRISRAIESMRNQTYRNLEIIVVDDHSTDGTAEIVKEIAGQDSRVHYYLLPEEPAQRTNWRGYDINAGYSARNFGFRIAQGEWITTQDADDASLLNRIETQYRLAKKYGALLVTIQWMQLNDQTLNKTLGVEKIFTEKEEDSVVIKPMALSEQARTNRGALMREPWHKHIPFPIKWFPYTRKLFYRRTDSYPGADNSMFFHKSVRDKGYYLRSRNERAWGVPSGRGSGRDFVYRVALELGNSWSFRLPMYLWNVRIQNTDYLGYEKYLK